MEASVKYRKHETISQKKSNNNNKNQSFKLDNNFQQHRDSTDATVTEFSAMVDGKTGFIIGIFIGEGWEEKENKKEKFIMGCAFYIRKYEAECKCVIHSIEFSECGPVSNARNREWSHEPWRLKKVQGLTGR